MTTTDIVPGAFLTAIQTGKYLGLSISTIRRLAIGDKTFPKPKKIVRRCYYRREELDAWKQK